MKFKCDWSSEVCSSVLIDGGSGMGGSSGVPDPPSIRDFMAFEEHVRTSSQALGHDVNPIWYEIPLFYFTNPAAARGPHDDVPIAPGSQRFDYELEIAAVVGRAGPDLDPARARAHIAGYLVM